MTNTRATLEAALVADPDNVALHSAYADLLIEEGDPRGEYVRLELALEDAGLSADERADLTRRAADLRGRHERDWLGSLYHLVDPAADSMTTLRRAVIGDRSPVRVTWRRGWLDAVTFNYPAPHCVEEAAACPAGRLLRAIHANGGWDEPPEAATVAFVRALAGLPFRELTFNHYLGLGDRILSLLVELSVLDRLTGLTLLYCSVTDDGAGVLARAPATRGLRTLHLPKNNLTPVGTTLLAAAGHPDVGPQAWDLVSWRPDRDGA
jgi:uncharacterized protein (TIGR02996 family)